MLHNLRVFADNAIIQKYSTGMRFFVSALETCTRICTVLPYGGSPTTNNRIKKETTYAVTYKEI